jgi:hypothetical protein
MLTDIFLDNGDITANTVTKFWNYIGRYCKEWCTYQMKRKVTLKLSRRNRIWAELRIKNKNVERALREKQSCFIYGECIYCRTFWKCAFIQSMRKNEKRGKGFVFR